MGTAREPGRQWVSTGDKGLLLILMALGFLEEGMRLMQGLEAAGS